MALGKSVLAIGVLCGFIALTIAVAALHQDLVGLRLQVAQEFGAIKLAADKLVRDIAALEDERIAHQTAIDKGAKAHSATTQQIKLVTAEVNRVLQLVQARLEILEKADQSYRAAFALTADNQAVLNRDMKTISAQAQAMEKIPGRVEKIERLLCPVLRIERDAKTTAIIHHPHPTAQPCP